MGGDEMIEDRGMYDVRKMNDPVTFSSYLPIHPLLLPPSCPSILL